MAIVFENQCVGCPQGCIDCGRRRVPVMICDDCGDPESELWYAEDGKMYCKYCITRHLDKVVIEDAD